MWSNVFVFWLNVYCGPKQKIISCYIASIVFIRNKCFFFVLFLWILSNVKESLLILSRQSWELWCLGLLDSRLLVSEMESGVWKIFLGFILTFLFSATTNAAWNMRTSRGCLILTHYRAHITSSSVMISSSHGFTHLQILSSNVHFSASFPPVSLKLLLLIIFIKTKFVFFSSLSLGKSRSMNQRKFNQTLKAISKP